MFQFDVKVQSAGVNSGTSERTKGKLNKFGTFTVKLRPQGETKTSQEQTKLKTQELAGTRRPSSEATGGVGFECIHRPRALGIVFALPRLLPLQIIPFSLQVCYLSIDRSFDRPCS